jgi:hypothetical protein
MIGPKPLTADSMQSMAARGSTRGFLGALERQRQMNMDLMSGATVEHYLSNPSNPTKMRFAESLYEELQTDVDQWLSDIKL